MNLKKWEDDKYSKSRKVSEMVNPLNPNYKPELRHIIEKEMIEDSIMARLMG